MNNDDGLAGLRVALLVQVSMMVAVGVVVLALLSAGSTDGGAPLAALIVGAVGIGAFAAMWAAERQPIGCTDPQGLAEQFRTRFFVRIALLDLPALAGFLAAVTVDAGWVYLVGLAGLALCTTRVVPFDRLVERDQEMLHQSGCATPLASALREYPPRFGGFGGFTGAR